MSDKKFCGSNTGEYPSLKKNSLLKQTLLSAPSSLQVSPTLLWWKREGEVGGEEEEWKNGQKMEEREGGHVTEY